MSNDERTGQDHQSPGWGFRTRQAAWKCVTSLQGDGLLSRFYRYKELYENGGEEALHDVSKRKPILKNRVAPDIEKAVCEMVIKEPAYGQTRASNELRKQNIIVSLTGLRSIWLRNDLETKKKRLKALEAKVAQDGIVLTEAQVAALEAAKHRERRSRAD